MGNSVNWSKSIYYRPCCEASEDYVFTRVCHSVTFWRVTIKADERADTSPPRSEGRPPQITGQIPRSEDRPPPPQITGQNPQSLPLGRQRTMECAGSTHPAGMHICFEKNRHIADPNKPPYRSKNRVFRKKRVIYFV